MATSQARPILTDGCLRPDKGGVLGQRMMVDSNLFRITSFSSKPYPILMKYDVSIGLVDEVAPGQYQPASREGRDNKPLADKIQQKLFSEALSVQSKIPGSVIAPRHAESFAFDGKKIAITPLKLDWEEIVVHLPLPSNGDRGRRRHFEIRMKPTNEVDPGIIERYCKSDQRTIQASSSLTVDGLQSVLQCLDIALRQNFLSDENLKRRGQGKFYDLQSGVPIPDAAEVLKGFFQSARATQAGPCLNIDIASSAFIAKGPLLQVIKQVLGMGPRGMDGGGRGGFGGGRGGYGDREGFGGRGDYGGRGGYNGRGDYGGRGGYVDRGGYGSRGGYHDGGRGGYNGGGRNGYNDGGRRDYHDGGRGSHYEGQRDRTSQGSELQTLSASQLQLLRKRLVGAEIKVTHRLQAKPEKLLGFSPYSARHTKFTPPDGQEISVVEYFMQKYNRQVQYPDLPCALLKQGSMVPIEFCDILPGTIIMPHKMTSPMVQGLIKEAMMKPQDRLGKIMDIRQRNAYERDDVLKHFGVNVSNQPFATEARKLPEPIVSYKDNRRAMLRQGSWNLAQFHFAAPGDTLNVAVLINASNRSERECRQFACSLFDACRKVGMRIGVNGEKMVFEKCDVFSSEEKVESVMKEAGRAAYAEAGKRCPPQLYIVFVDSLTKSFYDAVKRVGALKLTDPVQTQCINVNKGFSRDDYKQAQYCANVSMKLNVKLGGINHVVQDLPKIRGDCMFIGADVTHAPLGSQLPSIVASVATTDGKHSRYNSELSAQMNEDRNRKAQEVILEAEEIYMSHLQAWMSDNKDTLPSAIIVFRDGVSEGEYQTLVNYEVDQLKSACKKIKSGYNPKLTFIVCGKRHHVRIFGQRDNRYVDRTGNLPPGTVVDTGITHPYAFDFYLQSQAGLIGTARPAHYMVVRDEIGFSSDELQCLIYQLSYTFARATRSVSLPPMAMYAHHLADKGRALIYGVDGSYSDTASTTSGSRSDKEMRNQIKEIAGKLNRQCREGSTPFKRTLWYM